ncbi:unnamed protein product [Owenia fusiformis]|uniref:Uncharacterized protein n=1 Tax=Owenia fusiformis TaxID=6347 RepID=A0A8J1UYX4_OWEFU|nr:unnamed protein product [Owenia fusiformis]
MKRTHPKVKAMAEASEEQNEQFKPILQCKLCLEDLDNPKLLPCHHSFCLKCVEGLVVNNDPEEPLRCPVCRDEWQVPAGGSSALRADFKINTLKEILAAQPCSKPTKCEHHPDKPLQLFCKEDSCAICISCTKDHTGHSFVELDAVVKEFEEEWNKEKEEYLKLLAERLKKVEDDKLYFKNENERLTKELEQDHKRVIEAINNLFSSLKQNIDEYHQKECQSRAALEENLQTSKAMIETFTTHLGTIQDNVEKARLCIGFKKQGLLTPAHLPPDPYQFRPCEIMHNRIIFGSLYQRGFDDNITLMSMLHHPMSMLSLENVQAEISQNTQMSISDDQREEDESMRTSDRGSIIQHSPEKSLLMPTQKYFPKPVVINMTKLSTLKWIRDIAEVDTSTRVVVRDNEVQFYNNSELTYTKHVSMNHVAITPDKCLALTNSTGLISIYDKEGVHKRDIKTPFTYLIGIACNDNGELVVNDRKPGTVAHIDYNTGEVVTITPEGLFPASLSIAVNLNNDVVVPDYSKHCITVVDRYGNKKMEYGAEGSDDGQLKHPLSVCTDGNNIIVADAGNNRVSLICSTGHLIKHLLTGEDGLMGPVCVAIGHQEHLLVGDILGNVYEVEFKE